MSNRPIESLFVERCAFGPPEAFRAKAVLASEGISIVQGPKERYEDDAG